ncbi:acyltransferase [Promicromonospora sp. CA-289599]|uniref:acyltransferase n=1 Tax=Promicromonospora sp. CA-289599 TaxID=3240014 RepID=UPI003D90845A
MATLKDRSKAKLCVLPDVTIHYPTNVQIGYNVFVNRGVQIDAPSSICIGDGTLIGPHVVINSGNHRFDAPDLWIRNQGHDLRPIIIGSDVWIGANVTILAGAIVGDGCVIGAGAVVSGKIPANSVATGIPARAVRRRGRRPTAENTEESNTAHMDHD